MSGDDEQSRIQRAAELLRWANRVAVLTGAGVSAESGVPTFRGGNGLWEGYRIEEVATPEAFRTNPTLVWRFYNQRRMGLATVQPNPGHYALAEMESTHFPDMRFTLITQNVDGLHRLAGNKRVLEVHGNLRRTRCTQCRLIEDRGTDALSDRPVCESCGGWLRPDIVWFGEMLPMDVWEQAAQATAECDVFLVIGTSAVVYPAAGLIAAARQVGARVIEINLAATDASDLADVTLLGRSGDLLPKVVERLKSL